MSASSAVTPRWITTIALAVFGLVVPGFSQSGPKNLVSPTYRPPKTETAGPRQLTKKEVNRLAATAESREDHLKVAQYYAAEATALDAQAAGYEQAAAALRRGPQAKNLMAPTTPERYEFIARGLRKQAQSKRALASSHERTATHV